MKFIQIVRYGTLSVLALFAQQSMAQHPDHLTCRNNDLLLLAPLHQHDPARLAEIDAADQALEGQTAAFAADAENRGGGSTYVIPVVFHIIHDNGPENISDEQIEDAMRVLNDDFNQLNADWNAVNPAFLGVVANVGITFRLAQKDPSGNCTRGITRTQSVLTYDGTQTMKDLIQWPRNKYLNVWVAASAAGAAGYTYTPGSVNSSWGVTADGIVLLHNYTGSIGTSSPQRSRTLTHEVGHWINLRHTWGPTNDPGLASNCSEDDNVSDTPNTVGWTSCNISGISCGSLDNVENYMEYSYCSKMFTNGQKTRMLAALNSNTAQRNQLWQPGNLAATGTNGTDLLCAAALSSDNRIVCAGSQVQFQDASYHGATSWSWSFPGGSPANSTQENPAVTYDTPGIYAVTLTAGNSAGSVSTTETNYITVLPATGAPTPYTEDFESVSTLPDAEWSVVNQNSGVTFALSNAAAYSGSRSILLNNAANDTNDIDELMSTTVDLSNATQVTLSFRHAFTRRASGDNDILRVYVSSDCGATWSLRKQMRASTNLTTAPDQTAPFTPNGPAQWAYTEVTNIISSFWTSDFRFKFWFQNQGGNNFWLDDININGMPVGLSEVVTASTEPLVRPNPATDQAELWLVMERAEATRIELFDALGRSLKVLHDGLLTAGEQRVQLPVAPLESGVYLVRIQQAGGDRVVRFVKR
ncbi:MAG: T9SS type A sorting domain-containing protein [Flavobacteriales bacterium]|nr:T9SS type A sorting domain-containing protein [Flavobacteriales bacterium]